MKKNPDNKLFLRKLDNKGPYIERHSDGTYTIFSGMPEFGYELISVIPLSYKLHTMGLLKATISGYDTQCLYWFSPSHSELNEKRSWGNVEKLLDIDFPNMSIHRSQLDWQCFSPPPYKSYFESSAIQFKKPTLIISNRINSEWGGKPINFINSSALNLLFKNLRERYQIIYIESSHFSEKYEDHAEFDRAQNRFRDLDLTDIITFSDLQIQYPDLTVNEIQCRLYSGCERFISSNGGLGILASYFKGENIIFSKKCKELNPDVNSFYGWYPFLSKAQISVVNNEAELLSLTKTKWIDEAPIFNILIRTSNRPNYFHDCVVSILDQDYKNFNIIVGFDDAPSERYIRKFPCTRVPLNKLIDKPLVQPEGDDYGIWFPFNDYFNDLLSYATAGFVIYLDDDDCFVEKTALSNLAKLIRGDGVDAIFWRVKFPNRLVPSDKNWKKKIPVCRDVSTIGYAHSAAIKPVWEPWKRGDFRVARFVHNTASKTSWIDRVFTGLQRKIEDGYGQCDDKPAVDVSYSPPISIVISAYDALNSLEGMLDSVILQKNDFPLVNILVGVNDCKKTQELARGLAEKYSAEVQFWFSKNKISEACMRNSLVKKIQRRDSLILFFDSNSLMPNGFLQGCVNSFLEARRNKIENVFFRFGFVDFSSILNSNSRYITKEDMGHNIISRVVQNGVNSTVGKFSTLLIAHRTLENRYSLNTAELKKVCNASCDVIMLDYKDFELVGGYNCNALNPRIDLVVKLKSIGINMIDDLKSWFIFGYSQPGLDGLESRHNDFGSVLDTASKSNKSVCDVKNTLQSIDLRMLL